MKKYTYQILRYLPDRVSGEFVNIGLVLFNKEEKYVRINVLSRIGRVRHLFPNVNTKSLIKKLKTFSSSINRLNAEWQNESKLTDHKSIKSITLSVLPEDDSALIFSDVFTGIDLSFDNAFDDLYNRLVIQYDLRDEKYLTDRDVWSKYYKAYFDKYNYKKLLEKRTIKTKGDNLKFDHAVKNGKWNYLEPVTFDLSKPSNIKEKVYKWMGKLEELDSSEEIFNLYLLSKLPEDDKLKNFIKDRILRTDADNFQVKIIEPQEADQFAQSLKLELDQS